MRPAKGTSLDNVYDFVWEAIEHSLPNATTETYIQLGIALETFTVETEAHQSKYKTADCETLNNLSRNIGRLKENIVELQVSPRGRLLIDQVADLTEYHKTLRSKLDPDGFYQDNLTEVCAALHRSRGAQFENLRGTLADLMLATEQLHREALSAASCNSPNRPSSLPVYNFVHQMKLVWDTAGPTGAAVDKPAFQKFIAAIDTWLPPPFGLVTSQSVDAYRKLIRRTKLFEVG